MELEAAMVYARALYGAAEDLGHVHEVQEEINAIDKALRNELDFQSMMRSPAYTKEQKKDIFCKIFGGKVHEEVLSFLCILVDKNRHHDLHGIVREYNHIVDDAEGTSNGVIYSAIPLKEDQMAKFEEDASKLLQRRVSLRNKIDTSLIGGVKLFVEGKMIDASISSRLERMADRIRNS